MCPSRLYACLKYVISALPVIHNSQWLYTLRTTPCSTLYPVGLVWSCDHVWTMFDVHDQCALQQTPVCYPTVCPSHIQEPLKWEVIPDTEVQEQYPMIWVWLHIPEEHAVILRTEIQEQYPVIQVWLHIPGEHAVILSTEIQEQYPVIQVWLHIPGEHAVILSTVVQEQYPMILIWVNQEQHPMIRVWVVQEQHPEIQYVAVQQHRQPPPTLPPTW